MKKQQWHDLKSRPDAIHKWASDIRKVAIIFGNEHALLTINSTTP
jgi:hypothetical protein